MIWIKSYSSIKLFDFFSQSHVLKQQLREANGETKHTEWCEVFYKYRKKLNIYFMNTKKNHSKKFVMKINKAQRGVWHMIKMDSTD